MTCNQCDDGHCRACRAESEALRWKKAFTDAVEANAEVERDYSALLAAASSALKSLHPCYVCSRKATKKTEGLPATCDEHVADAPSGLASDPEKWTDLPQAALVRLLEKS